MSASGVQPADASTPTATFTAVADSYVVQQKPTTNFGTQKQLKLQSSPITRSYVRFNVQGLSDSVVSATLRLKSQTTTSVGYDVRSVADNTWGETTITYQNAPAPSGTITGSSGALTSGQWSSVDVTPLVAGNGLISVALTTTNSAGITLSGRGTSSAAPQLVVQTLTDVPPANTSPPSISGAAQVGQALTASTGSWSGTQPISYAYQWQRCDSSGAGCADISAATGQTYTLASLDVGSTIRVAVTASSAAGSSRAVSAQTGVVSAAATPPVNSSSPSISGTAQVGQALTASTGSWSGTQPISFAYQWRRCDTGGANCADIAGATAQTRAVVTADAGSTLRVAVTASNSAGSATSTSAASAVVGVGSVCSPQSSSYTGAVLGTSGLVAYWRLGESSGAVACDSAGSNNGSYLTGTTLGQPGAIANDPDTAVGFNGTSGWVSVPSNASLNVGDRFSLEAWVKRGSVGGSSNQVIASKQTGAWVLMFNASNQLVLRKSGAADLVVSTAKVTDTTSWHYVAATKDGTAVHLYIDGSDVTGTVTNQAMADNTQPLAIGQSSGSTFFNGSIDEVALYNVAISAAQVSNHYGIGAPGQPPVNLTLPTISGTAQAGQTLTASPGAWAGTAPLAYTYQWSRCPTNGVACAPIASATASTYIVGNVDVGAVLRVGVTATNSVGTANATSNPTTPATAASSPPGDPVIAAAGDIACDPNSLDFNNGLGTPTACEQQATSNLLVGQNYSAVLALGDDQYYCGGYQAFQQSYDPTWGRVKSITHPVPGNHEYLNSAGTDCDPTGHAAGYYQYFGAAAGNPTAGYYSFDIGSWHVVALNSNCAQVGGCGAGSAQETWLKADLATHVTQCTLAFWHHPRFTSGEVGSDAEMATVWQDLYNSGVDLVLNGHAHGYERFAPQNPSQNYDSTSGIREIVVGTGGEDFGSFPTPQPNSENRQASTFGILSLTLHANSYDWQFVPIAGKTYSDSGTTFCH